MSQQILIVSHDAGGAEVVSSWVQHNPDASYTFLLDGIATTIFKRKLGNIRCLSRAEAFSADTRLDLVLTGTSWASSLEKEAIRHFRSRQIKVAVFLEHWTRYRDRFELDGKLVLPDEVWVGDKYAQALATRDLPGVAVVRRSNYYMSELVTETRKATQPKLETESALQILYVTEPTSAVALNFTGDTGGFLYTEFEALDGFLKYLEIHKKGNYKIRLRLHPSEAAEKYGAQIQTSPWRGKIQASQNTPLAEDCGWADWIVGCNSMVMAIGAEAGKKVFCSIPSGGRPSDIPYEQIIRLFPPT